MNIGIFLPNWIGDVVMATPTLRALRRHFGSAARFTGVLRPYVADVLQGTSWLDEEIYYDPGAGKPELGTRSLIGQLRARKLDVALLMTNSFRTGWLAFASGARERVGYVRYCRGLLLTHKLYEPRRAGRRVPSPAIDTYLRLAYTLGCPTESPELELVTRHDDEAHAERVWQRLKLPQGKNVVVFNSGGAYGAAKHWPARHFGALARRIAVEQDLSVLVSCGPKERTIAEEIVRTAGHPRVVSVADEESLPIGLTKAIMRRSRMLVTTDSGPRFFAIAFGLPVVSLFGPTDKAWSTTHGTDEICLSHDLPCSPCQKRTCPLLHHHCMTELSVEEVYRAVKLQLTSQRPSQVA